MPGRAFMPLPLSRGDKHSVALLVLLMLLSALTEGFGLVLLVPMLGVLGGSDAVPEPVTQALADIGLPLTLPVLLALFVLLVALRALVNYARTMQSFALEIAIVDGLRERAWNALLHCDWRHLSQMNQTDNASLLISNVDRVGYGISEALRGLAILITLGGLGLAALVISPWIAVAAAAIGVAVLIAYRGMRRRAAKLGDELTDAWDRVHSHMTEGLGALRIIKSFAREDHALETGSQAFAGLRETQRAFLRDAGLAQASLHVGGALCLAALVWVATVHWGAGAVQVLPLVALFARALPLIGSLQQTLQNWAHARPAADAALSLIETAEAEREPAEEDGPSPPALSQAITLEGVTVRYAGRDRHALEAASIAFPAGSITAIAGPSGAGKSTLADLIAGLIAPDQGIVSVDGIMLDGGLRRAWRSRVTYVQQDPLLFTGTVRSNLLWADPYADEARLATALGDASADFVHDLPEGLDTRVGEGGRQLSGGERQRIVLARALLRDPALLILDEAASALDLESESRIAEAVARLRGRMTIVIIGHKGVLGDVAERDIRLESGRVVEVRERRAV
ncbi:MAG: ABC transporter ATP-binding protein [Sphingomonadaceae bacterium]